MSNDYIFETEEEIRERIARNLEDESKREAYIASLDNDDRSAYMQHFAEEEERQRFYQEAIAKDLETTRESLQLKSEEVRAEEVIQRHEDMYPQSKSFSRMDELGFRSEEDKLLWEHSYMHPEHGRMNRLTGEPWKDGDFEALQQYKLDTAHDARKVYEEVYQAKAEAWLKEEELTKHEREEDLNFALDDVELHEEREENLNFALDDVELHEEREENLNFALDDEVVQKEYLVRGELKELDEMALNPNEGKPMPSVLIDDIRLYGHETVDDFKRAGAEVGNVVGYDGYSKVDILEKTQEKDEPKAPELDDIPFDDPAFEKAYFATQEAEQEQEQEIERNVPEWYSEMCEEQSMAWMEEVIPDQEYHSGYELEEEPTLTR